MVQAALDTFGMPPSFKAMKKALLGQAHDFCPDHRDKQRGRSCLACALETSERKRNQLTARAESAERRLRELSPVAALLRTHDCFDDDEDTDIGRPMIDALVACGWMERTQHSPARWTITGEGTRVIDAALGTSQASSGETMK